MDFAGLRILESPHAVTVRVWWTVEKIPIRKRRRNWRVVRNEKHDPCMYRLGRDVMVVHPSIMVKIKEAA